MIGGIFRQILRIFFEVNLQKVALQEKKSSKDGKKPISLQNSLSKTRVI